MEYDDLWVLILQPIISAPTGNGVLSVADSYSVIKIIVIIVPLCLDLIHYVISNVKL
jgi:hypothetical protein